LGLEVLVFSRRVNFVRDKRLAVSVLQDFLNSLLDLLPLFELIPIEFRLKRAEFFQRLFEASDPGRKQNGKMDQFPAGIFRGESTDTFLSQI
jgi:hypothetical protein